MTTKTSKEENEKMLKVIEGKPTWSETVQDLVPLLYSLAISNVALNVVSKSMEHTKNGN